MAFVCAPGMGALLPRAFAAARLRSGRAAGGSAPGRDGGRAAPASLRNRQSARLHNNSALKGLRHVVQTTAPPLAISSAAFTARSGPTGRAPAAQTSREGTSQKQKGHPKAASARSEESRLSLVIKDHPNPIDMINQLWVVEHRIGRQIDDNWQ